MNSKELLLTGAEQQRLLSGCERLIRRFDTVLLATLGEQGAELSYAPYIRSDRGDFYIFISGLASHTSNLRRDGQCQLMFIADESDSRNLFARERLTWQCQARQVEVSDPDYLLQLDRMQDKLGETVGLLRGLADFCLFRISPSSGRYVVGFGKAYQIDPAMARVNPVSG